MDPKATAAAAAAPAAAGEKKQDFEGAFSEFAQGKKESAPADGKADVAAGADVSKDSPPAAETDKPSVAGEPAAGATTAAAPATVDPWKDAPQALREAHERELAEARTRAEQEAQKARSAEGRYKAAISKTSELERKLASGVSIAADPNAARPAAAPAAAAAAPAATAAAKPAAPASGAPAAADPKGPQMPPEWNQLMETLPDVAKAVEARFGAVDKAVKDALAAVKPMQEAEAARFQREQGTLLSEAYPGWEKAVTTPEFNAWIKQQPQSVQALAVSDYAADNAALLEYYGYQPPKKNPEPAAHAAPGGKSAAEIAAERDARLARNTTVRSQGAAPLADAPDNFEQAFTFYARKRMASNDRRA